MATCRTSNEKSETSYSSTKRATEVAAVEGMYHALLADPDIRDKEATTLLPTKTSKDYPSDWSKMRHPMFLSGGGKCDESLDGEARETDTDMLNEIKGPTARLNHLAETNGFTLNFAEWSPSKFLQLQGCFTDTSLNGHEKGEVSQDKSTHSV
ncbi:hypothetical protein RvY_00645-1 [Ramazzottius varieornatus]|uniref:Uncharacterized protein n=1 Tax=Ramazzottius varieornatus TaxID=947166 RepID=A0A1D1UDI0_RAMVA|nr:hypothetical protein RvY_00645-1 [Ramazzottius varieornatus]